MKTKIIGIILLLSLVGYQLASAATKFDSGTTYTYEQIPAAEYYASLLGVPSTDVQVSISHDKIIVKVANPLHTTAALDSYMESQQYAKK